MHAKIFLVLSFLSLSAFAQDEGQQDPMDMPSEEYHDSSPPTETYTENDYPSTTATAPAEAPSRPVKPLKVMPPPPGYKPEPRTQVQETEPTAKPRKPTGKPKAYVKKPHRSISTKKYVKKKKPRKK